MGDYAEKSSDRRGKRKHVNEEKAEKGSVSESEELRRLRNEEVQCAQRGRESEEET
jgi:hypothetical protein